MEKIPTIVAIMFGAVVLNTMPVWLGDVASHPGVSDTGAGAIGSLVLGLAAVFCWGGAAFLRVRVASLFVPGFLILLALGPILPTAIIVLSGAGLGIAVGRVTGDALSRTVGMQGLLKTVSIALSLGLAVSMIFYLVFPVLDISPFWLLAVLSLVLIVQPAPTQGMDSKDLGSILHGLPLRFLPFFVMMGGYWSFLDLFGHELEGATHLPAWLLGSLVSGALGSLLAGFVAAHLRSRVSVMALFAAALTGALSYVATDISVLGISILANGFFLFLFFPLYLASHPHGAPKAMAAYLLGFACGGAAGAFMIEIGGYPMLAAAILLSILPTIALRPAIEPN